MKIVMVTTDIVDFGQDLETSKEKKDGKRDKKHLCNSNGRSIIRGIINVLKSANI